MRNQLLTFFYNLFSIAPLANSQSGISLNLNNGISYDAAQPWQMGFQDSASPGFTGIIELHDTIFFYLVLISVGVFWVLSSIIYNYNYKNSPIVHKYLNHGTLIELIWTITPAFILIAIAFPSFRLLYLLDEVISPTITIKVVGHQWYWSYEYSDYISENGDSVEFDSYMIPESDLELGQFRLLEVDNKIIIPTDTHIRFIVTAADVLHSFALPSFGLKIDAVPGRLNQSSILCERTGTYYGQCSEICGVYHGFMPIVVEAVSVEDYLTWIDQTASALFLLPHTMIKPLKKIGQRTNSSAATVTTVGSIGKTNRLDFQYFPFHMVDPSPWPILLSFSLLNLTVSAVLYMHGYANGGKLLSLAFILTSLGMLLWFRDVVTESTHLGHHTKEVTKGLTIGIQLFIISEIFAFLSIFWAYLHSSLTPAIEIGGSWPPQGVVALDPFAIPLLNTFLLLSSGAFITYGHHALIKGDRRGAIMGSLYTIILAIIFTYLQYFEYSDADFNISDSVFGSAFFASTGLHGLHVIVGTIFISIGFYRIILYHLTDTHHQGFESSIVYWHFVDAVWLALWLLAYLWASEDNSLLIASSI